MSGFKFDYVHFYHPENNADDADCIECGQKFDSPYHADRTWDRGRL